VTSKGILTTSIWNATEVEGKLSHHWDFTNMYHLYVANIQSAKTDKEENSFLKSKAFCQLSVANE
jgi:hypothetical protein